MLKNYLVTALRALARNKLTAAINILGLAVSLTAVLLIAAFVRYEFGYDRNWTDGERVYRLTNDIAVDGHPTVPDANTQPPIVPAMGSGFPGVEVAARTFAAREIFGRGSDVFYERVTYADPAFLDMYVPRILSGVADISAPDTVILSRSLARKLFGDADPTGASLQLDGDETLTVTGVMADAPKQSHLRPAAIAAFDSTANPVGRFLESYGVTIVRTYIKLLPEADPAVVRADIQALVDRLRPRNGERIDYNLQPLHDIHLRSSRYAEGGPRGDILTVTAFSAAALLILLISGMNYTNLSTAQAIRRAREVGLRKVVGAARSQIALQFTGESLLLSLGALMITFGLAELLMDPFAAFIDRPLDTSVLRDPGLVLIGFTSAILVALSGAIYPAIVLSSFDPAQVLRGEALKIKGIGLRSLLVALQFAISIVLISSTAVVTGQMNHLRTTDVGYDREGVIALRGLRDADPQQAAALVRHVRTLPGVLAAITSGDIPTGVPERYFGLRKAKDEPDLDIAIFDINAGYLDLFDIPLLAGRGFDAERPTDFIGLTPDGDSAPNAAVILNRSGARFFGFATPEDAVGKTIYAAGGEAALTIIGVIGDVRFGSAKDTVRATAYISQPDRHSYLLVKVADDGFAITATRIEEDWRRFMTGVPLQMSYIEALYRALYDTEAKQETMLTVFASLAVFVSCLGLYALSALAAQQRTKEMGLRRVFGARHGDVLWLVFRQFTKPILIAGVIAGPCAWYLTRDWLNGFVERIELTFWPFLLAGVAALAVAWATVSVHAFRVSRTHPALALRKEQG